MLLYVVEIPAAVPPLTVTADPAQVQAWRDEGLATAVYEFDAAQTYPAPDTPEETIP